MDSEEKRLIEEIKEGLFNFEIPYEEGNWENFQQTYGGKLNEIQRRKRKPTVMLWKYISAAAVLIGVLIYFQWPRPESDEIRRGHSTRQATATTEDKILVRPSLPPAKEIPMPAPAKDRVSRAVKSNLVTIHRVKATAPVVPAPIEAAIQRQVALQPKPESQPESPEDVAPTLNEPEADVSANRTASPIAALDHDDRNEPGSSRWKFGIELNSSLTTDKPNMAAGVITQFEVSGKLKLSTGLTYSRISASHETDPVQLTYDTRRVGGESLIKALDIPLSLVYEPTNGWYASVGVSALAVLDEEKMYRMESEMLEENVTVDPESGAFVSVFKVVTEEFSAESTDTDFEGRSNLGYLNLSIGRKQRLNKQTDLLFEPFLKIPMGGLQRNDMNLMTSGIKIKLLF